MCELLGMSANVPTDIVFSFTGLMQRGGRTGPHRDGWGIAFYEGRGLRLFQDPAASCESEVALLVQRYPIKSEVVIGHIRQANVGKVSSTLEDVGLEIGLTRERVRQIQVEGLKRLREILERNGLSSESLFQ